EAYSVVRLLVRQRGRRRASKLGGQSSLQLHRSWTGREVFSTAPAASRWRPSVRVHERARLRPSWLRNEGGCPHRRFHRGNRGCIPVETATASDTDRRKLRLYGSVRVGCR